MKYICLAAGRGERISPINKIIQKCMYPIEDKPFLEYSILNLIKNKYFDKDKDELIIICNYKHKQIRTYFKKKYNNLKITYLKQKKINGTANAIKTSYKKLKKSNQTIIWLADTYIKKELFEKIIEDKSEFVLTYTKNKTNQYYPYSIEINNKNVLTKAYYGNNRYIDVGIWKINPKRMKNEFNNKENKFLLIFERLIKKGIEIKGIRIKEKLHIGSNERRINETINLIIKDDNF